MRKLNISGLVKKCKELWKNVVEIKDIIKEEFKEESDEDRTPTDPFADAEEQEDSEGNVEESEEELSLDNVKEMFESYIGIIITGFITHQEDIPDIEHRVRGCLVGGVEVRGHDIYLKLYKISGNHGGYIKISPSIGGQFTENSPNDNPSTACRYRIIFFGEDQVEYEDSDGKGKITFLGGYI